MKNILKKIGCFSCCALSIILFVVAVTSEDVIAFKLIITLSIIFGVLFVHNYESNSYEVKL